jgi:hypothetical protein
MFIKPAPGLVVRDPVTKTLIKTDQVFEVDPGDLYWNRLLRDGDVVVVTQQPAAASASTPTA